MLDGGAQPRGRFVQALRFGVDGGFELAASFEPPPLWVQARQALAERLGVTYGAELPALALQVAKPVPLLGQGLGGRFGVSEWRPCTMLGASQMMVRYRPWRPDDAGLRDRMKALACRRFGYPGQPSAREIASVRFGAGAMDRVRSEVNRTSALRRTDLKARFYCRQSSVASWHCKQAANFRGDEEVLNRRP